MTQRHFILAAPFFPPMGSSGVQRRAKLAKYTQRAGWTPRVLTMSKPPTRQYPTDPILGKEVAHLDVQRLPRFDLRLGSRAVHRLGMHALATRLEWLIPMDGFAGWTPMAIAAAEALLRQNPRPELIYTTSYPFSVHLVGWWLKKRHGIPWVADFRDPWTTNERYIEYLGLEPVTRWKLWVDRHLETAMVQAADVITVVVDQHRQDLIERFGVPPHKVHTIFNGYDEEDFSAFPYPMAPASDMFRVTFFGRFFRKLNPGAFLDMLRLFLGRCPQPQSVRFRIVGEGSQWLRDRLDQYGDMAEHFELMDYVPHAQVPGLMQQSSVLLIIFPRPWSITGKIFEYMRSGLPVLGLAPCHQTQMEQMLAEVGTGTVVLSEDIEAGAAALQTFFEAWQGQRRWPTAPSLEAVTSYSRQAQAGRFMELFEEAVSTTS